MEYPENLEELAAAVKSVSMEPEEAMAPPSTPACNFAPEEVLKMRLDVYGNRLYLVKWFGLPIQESTWVAEHKLYTMSLSSVYLLDEFHKKLEDENNPEVPNPDETATPYPEMSAGGYVVEPKNESYFFNTCPEEVLGIIDKGMDHDFLVKWPGDEEKVVPRKLANRIWPDIVIKFYEKNLVWNKQRGNGDGHQ